MKNRINLTLLLLVTLMMTKPVFANQPPGPQMMLAEVLILPLMALLTSLGGGHDFMKQPHPVFKGIFIFLVITGGILSLAHEGFSLIFAVIFGLIALSRAIKLIYWGLKTRFSKTQAEAPIQVRPLQLILSGVLLATITVFLVGMSFAFLTFYVSRNAETYLRRFVAYQLAYARLEKEKTGQMRFHTITKDDERFGAYLRSMLHAQVEYGAKGQSFTIYAIDYLRFPFFPYNYLASAPSYRADESGQIRMVYVHHKDEPCPPDAPVVMKVEEKDIQEQLEIIKKAEER